MKEIATIEFKPDQIALIKSQIAKDCSNSELELFLYQCKQTGLNPLTRQIYAIKRSGKMTIQTSIDGFRVIAERSGSYAGQDEPLWEDDKDGKPVKCAVKVYRFTPNFEQRYCAGVGVAHFNEYYPNPILLQKSMPHTMIAKVAEALALRKAFPQDLSGLYTSDEMGQAGIVDKTPEVKQNQFSGMAEVADEDMKATLRAANEASFKLIKSKIEAADSLEEMAATWASNIKGINKLKKYTPDLYNLLNDCKEICKSEMQAGIKMANELGDSIDYAVAG